MKLTLTLQLLLALLLTVSGLALLFLGMYTAPLGKIDTSVLIAFGEISTFAGALSGVDWYYRHQSGKKGGRDE